MMTSAVKQQHAGGCNTSVGPSFSWALCAVNASEEQPRLPVSEDVVLAASSSQDLCRDRGDRGDRLEGLPDSPTLSPSGLLPQSLGSSR